MRRNLLWILVSLTIIVVDRITKILVLHRLPYAEPVAILPFFNLFFVHNTGAAFSFLGDFNGWQNWLFSGIAAGVSCLLIVKLWRAQLSPSLQMALALVLGGALGNFYDRVSYRYVIDFLDFYIKNWHWPTFNIADSAICIGAVMLVWWSISRQRRS